MRTQSLIRVGQSYFRKNSKAARNWLADSGLSESVKREILNPKRKKK